MTIPLILPKRLAAVVDVAATALREFGAIVRELAERAMWAAVRFMLVPASTVIPIFLSLAYVCKMEYPAYFDVDPNGYAIIAFSILLVSFFACVKKDWRRTAATWVRLSAAGFVTWFGIEMSFFITHGADVPVVTLLCALVIGGAHQLFFNDLAKEQADLELEDLVNDAVHPVISESISIAESRFQSLGEQVSTLTREIHELRTELQSVKAAEKAPESTPE